MYHALLIAIPCITGLQAALWSRIVAGNVVLGSVLSVLAFSITAASLVVTGYPFPRQMAAPWTMIVAYVVANVALSWVWILATCMNKGAGPTGPALADVAWPLFTCTFMWVLFHTFNLSRPQVLGATVAMVGVAIMTYGAKPQ